ncbi:MAG: hypothetical protein BBJ57_06300 [Desulfobacterales bacterium PC51MH44]|nr:MAG: hypothetical protein BBJ57_06300 [Desulfobacterales bacterium PC51MH44]
MSIYVIYPDDSNFKTLWQSFVERNNVSWRYSPERMEYEKVYCHKTLIQDCSFVIKKDDLPVAICPLFLEEQNEHHFFSSDLGYQTAPFISSCLSEKQRKKIERLCFEEIDKLAKKNGVVKCMRQIDPVIGGYSYNVLTKYGYLDASLQTVIVDLRNEIKSLWSTLRKSFKSLINNGKENFNILIMDSENPDYEIHEAYRKLHHKTSGRITRPLKTFDMQFEDLKNDRAILIGLKEKERFVAFSYFSHYQNSVYYGSSSDDPDYESKIPLEHCIIWAAIEYYKKRGFSFFEVGVQQFRTQFFDHPSQKDLNICFFKRGFGGKIIPFYRGIKYYDTEVMKQDLECNMNRLLRAHQDE